MTRLLLRSVEAQLVIERRLDELLSSRRPLRTLGPEHGRRVRMAMHVVALRAPDLLDWYPALVALTSVEPLRPMHAFMGGTLSELAQHLFVAVRYPLPDFLMVLIHAGSAEAVRALSMLGVGGNVRDLKPYLLPTCFTRRMAHELWLVARADTWAHAVRQAQVAALGGSRCLANVLNETRLRSLRPGREAWWQQVITWLIEVDFPVDTVRRVVRFLLRWAWDRRPAPKRQSVGRVLSELDRWEAERAHATESGPVRALPVSRFEPAEFRAWGHKWALKQLGTSFELYVEGRVLRHCVATYFGKAKAGHSTLWSLRKDGRRCITVEVSRDGEVIQAKGLGNRRPGATEHLAIQRWAKTQKLEVCVSAAG